ncbi:GTP-binding nuclear protein Ran-like isoform X1 [Drosophila pseudoobscura]|uniref:GTP-binding nuclear protein Ran-like isoform X1 n=2 Tax=Drosophila pseudoobscura pseudoobscura TaxID=46245 RepID=B5DKC2_DROPS|nr:GTP-binding nuclear protein Ran isoform X1 [Drosophila pseudoobscura]
MRRQGKVENVSQEKSNLSNCRARTMDVPTYKCIIMGEKCCGKTTFLKRHLTGEFVEEYVHTARGSTSIVTLTFNSNRGPIQFDVFDWGQENEELLLHPEDFYKDGQCAIVMFDVSSVFIFGDFFKQFLMLNLPISLCGNKADIKTDNYSVYDPENFLSSPNLEKKIFSEISVKTGLNIDQPFLYLARKLLNDFTLEFIPSTNV